MTDYDKIIINKLLDIYERRGAYKKDDSQIRSITLSVADTFHGYTDNYDHTIYREVNLSIERLLRANLIIAEPTARGDYDKIRLNISQIQAAYKYTKRTPLINKYRALEKVLEEYENTGFMLIDRLISDLHSKINSGKKLPYGIEYNDKRLSDVMRVLKAVLSLHEETYIRNFSLAVFKDSKVFQKDFKSTIQSILYDFTKTTVEKDRILEVYNLYDNPTYVLLKGHAVIITRHSKINLADFSGGIAIPEKALSDIERIMVGSDAVITVENLTTFHDCTDADDLTIYLGGFHNTSKEILLKLIYAQNPNKRYLHKGDLDIFGFAILESLKKRTGIPFEPLEMDIVTLSRFYEAGLYKPLTDADKKAMQSPDLRQYEVIFRYMLDHNCKVEQESVKAIALL